MTPAMPESMTATEFRRHLKRLDACSDGRAWVGRRDLATAWNECERADWLLWLAGHAGVDRRALVRAAADCAETALQYVPEGETRPRKAIEAARRWADAPTEANRQAARDAANAAAAYAAYANAAYDAAYDAANAAANAAAAYAAYANAAYANAAYANAAYANAAYAYAAAYAAANAAAANAAAANAADAYAAANAAAYAAAYAAANAAVATRGAALREMCVLVRRHISVDMVQAALRGEASDAVADE